VTASLKRQPTWRSALVKCIEARRKTAFRWGTNDCALFAADCIQAMTGTDLAAVYRGRYTSEAGARAILQATGYADVAAVAASMLAEIHPSRAATGDVAVMEYAGEPSLGIFNGALIMALRPDGIGTVPFTAAVRAFRVP